MSGHGEKLSRKMNDFILALMTARTLDEAAAAVGISSATAYRWYKLGIVKAELKRLQDEVVGHSLSKLKLSASEALEVLRSVANDEVSPPSARVAAARTILDNVFRSIETADVLERLESLEARIGDDEK
jgi:hypothetical protein